MNEEEEIDLINMSIRNAINEDLIPVWEAHGFEVGMESEEGEFMVSSSLLGNVIMDIYSKATEEGNESTEDFEAGVTWAMNIIIHTMSAARDHVLPMYVQDILNGSEDD